ncbi:hypothetical protein Hanom_Chr07g00629551 [Helianthus anomalus]
MLVDELEEDETETNIEEDHEQLSPETEQLLKSVDDTLEAGKSASQKNEVDAEVDRWIKENFDPRDREIQKKRKRSSADDDDKTYVPPENIQLVSPPSSGGRKKSISRKRVITPPAS